MAAADSKPNWTQLPRELLDRIARKTRDDVTAGVTLFRSVCRAWRAAARAAPRLLLPAPPRAGSDYALVFPLARGWSVVVDVRDTSCRLSHLATGATAPLPNLTAVRATPTSRVVITGYEHFDAPAASPEAAAARVPRRRRISFLLKLRFRLRTAAAVAGNRWPRARRRRSSRWQVRMDPAWVRSLRLRLRRSVPKPSPCPENKIQHPLRLPRRAGGGADGTLILMYHPLHGQTGLVFCRPGDAAWTKLDNTVVEDDEDAYNGASLFSFADFAYLGGRIFALDINGGTAVFDAATLDVLDVVDVPPGTTNFATKMWGCCHPQGDMNQRDYLHLVALPSRLLCVRVRVRSRSSEPVSFDVFELAQDRHDGLAWRKVVVGLDGIIGGGDYDLFLDGHHATFHRGGGGGRIYYVHDLLIGACTAAAYCYSMKDETLECVYRPPAKRDGEYSTNPSWFVP
ncbi:hypothetical protein C2845_PM04G06690 [Panicum miliaceum]|uniref:KIB1-4 beta-propeller domain-containing protein n=1 Tax=Panicum miliaceum TaxID=4540 RepID=A0A3L6QT08_PANMI|nr:hypothetical protein C2845_PM04G06690 [Panicum miliaceum]